MSEDKKKTNKRLHGDKAGRQWARTARNKQKSRARHANEQPNDEQARTNWLLKPIKFSK